MNEELVGFEILIVDSDEDVRNELARLLEAQGFIATATSDEDAAERMLREKFFVAAMCDLDSPTAGAGLAFVQAAHRLSPATAVIVMTNRRAYDAAVSAFRAGADDVVLKSPDQVDYLLERIRIVAGRHRQRQSSMDLLTDVANVHEEFLKLTMDLFKKTMDLRDRLENSRIEGQVTALCRMLIATPDERIGSYLQKHLLQEDGWLLSLCQTGGEVLDHVSRQEYHIVVVSSNLPDLPTSMVTKTVKSQVPDTIVVEYQPPGDGPGSLTAIDMSGTTPVLEEFRTGTEFLEGLQTLRRAFQAKLDQRRYLQAFRVEHFDFLKKYADMRSRIQKLLKEYSQQHM